MSIRSLITMAALLAALAACNAPTTPSLNPLRGEAAIQASEGHWLAAAQMHDFERAFRADARE